jgi:hypothetical protein
MPIYADRVLETTATAGTGTVTLAGAVSGYQSFLTVFPTGTNRVFYTITNGSQWEVGSGTYTSSGTTLSRDTIFASSNAGAAITLAGNSNVWLDFPAIAIADRGVVIAAMMRGVLT